MTFEPNSVVKFQAQRAEARARKPTKLDLPYHGAVKIRAGGRRQCELLAALMVASMVGVTKP